MSSDHTRPTPYSRDEIRAQSGLEAAEFDARAIRDLSVPQSVLMENAGRSAALVIQALHLPRRLVGMVGAGNNGGDALVVLRTMAAWGVDVMALLVADRGADDPLLHGWPIRTVSDADLPDDARDRLLDDADVIVDGVLGTGVRGAARDRQAAAIEAMNRSSTPVVALDMPSGADATTGDVPGSDGACGADHRVRSAQDGWTAPPRPRDTWAGMSRWRSGFLPSPSLTRVRSS